MRELKNCSNLVDAEVGFLKAKGEAEMKSSKAEVKKQSRLSGKGLLSFVALLVMVFATGTPSFAKTKNKTKDFPPHQLVKVNGEETWRQLEVASPSDISEAKALLNPDLGIDKAIPNASDFLETYLHTENVPGKGNDFVAMSEAYLSVLQDVTQDEATAKDNVKKLEKLLTNPELNLVSYGDHWVAGDKNAKDKEDQEGHWESNKEGVTALIKKLSSPEILEALKDAKSKKDLINILRTQVFNNKELMELLGLSSKPTKKEEKARKPEKTKKGEETAKSEDNKPKDDGAAKPVNNVAQTPPQQPQTPPTGPIAERPFPGCNPNQPNPLYDFLKNYMADLVKNAANKKGGDGELQALADSARGDDENRTPPQQLAQQPQAAQVPQNNESGYDNNPGPRPDGPQPADDSILAYSGMQLPQVKKAPTDKAEFEQPTISGETEVASAKSALAAAKKADTTLEKALSKPEIQPGYFAMAKSAAMAAQGFFTAYGKQAEYKAKAQLQSANLSSSAESHHQLAANLKKWVKENDPKSALLEDWTEQSKALAEQVTTLQNLAQSYTTKMMMATTQGTRSLLMMQQNQAKNLLAQAQKESDDIKKNIATGEKIYKNKTVAAVDQNASQLEELAKQEDSEAEALNAKAGSFEDLQSQSQMAYAQKVAESEQQRGQQQGGDTVGSFIGQGKFPGRRGSGLSSALSGANGVIAGNGGGRRRTDLGSM